MSGVRSWSVRHADVLDGIYKRFEKVLMAFHPLWRVIGYERLELPFQAVERATKGFLFDCQMCGQCALSSTGMSCPMNCPKDLRNGPCGGVRPNGNCEVNPEMRCVWVEAWEGAAKIGEEGIQRIREVQRPVDHSLQGRSSWLRVVRMEKKVGEFALETHPSGAVATAGSKPTSAMGSAKKVK